MPNARSDDTKHPSRDGIIEGFRISRETLDHLDPIKRAVAAELIRQERWVLYV